MQAHTLQEYYFLAPLEIASNPKDPTPEKRSRTTQSINFLDKISE